MVLEITNYRDIIKEHFNTRTSENPNYSLRAFARDLSISPASLSEVLNGKQGLSIKKAKVLALKLGLNPTETEYFCDLIESEHGTTELKKELAKARLTRFSSNKIYTKKQLDMMNIVSEWYHMAILELTYIDGFKPSIDWVAKALNLPLATTKEAIERLIRMELLIEKDGTWIGPSGFMSSTDGVPSEKIQKYHKQILDKAKIAISTQDIKQRNLSSLIIAVNKEQIPEVNSRISKFQEEICDLIAETDQKNSVYALNVQFFNLTQNLPGETNE